MKITLIALATLAASSSAIAGQRLNYEQVKEACRNPEKFHNQIKPGNMEITCSDLQTRWVPVDSDSYELPRMRKVTMSMTSDKYDIPASGRDMAAEPQGGECPRFKETIERVQATRATSCEEILDFDGSEIQFCAGLLDDIRRSNPGSISIVDSGRNVHFCSPNNPQQRPTPPVPPRKGKGGKHPKKRR